MRVIYFSRDYSPHDHRFLAALAETNHEVSYLRLEDKGRSQESRPVPVGIQQLDWWGGDRPIGRSDWPRAGWEVRQVFQQMNPDLVHAGPIQSCAFLSAAAGFHPLLAMSWGSDLMRQAQAGLGRIAARWTLKRSDVFTCDCEAVRQVAIGLGAPAEQTYVFPWGVDLDHFSPERSPSVRQALGWLSDEIVFLSMRAWEPIYGVLELAEAFAQVAQGRPELRLLMLGDGSLADELRNIFVQTGVAHQVVMPGQIKYQDLPSYYRAADLYISASYSDGSSVSLMEALACGLPALVSDIPGNNEWVEPYKNGWRFPVGQTEGLAESMQEVINRKDVIQEMGQFSRKVAEARADWPRNFSLLMAAYESAMELAK